MAFEFVDDRVNQEYVTAPDDWREPASDKRIAGEKKNLGDENHKESEIAVTFH